MVYFWELQLANIRGLAILEGRGKVRRDRLDLIREEERYPPMRYGHWLGQ